MPDRQRTKVGRIGKVRIGISGWKYAPWRGVFYPGKLAQRHELAFASKIFDSIELNGSFYSLQRPSSFRQWYAATPAHFVFSVKGSRYITHMRRLGDVEAPLANFFGQGLLQFAEKLGPILWQFPANFKFDLQKLEAFFQILPATHDEAAVLAGRHDERLNGRDWCQPVKHGRLRHAIEIRDESFVCDEFIRLLRRYRVGLVVADTVDWPLLMDVTADFVYCRLHGSEELYASGYSDQALDMWARRVVTWATGGEVHNGRRAGKRDAAKRNSRDVFVYFDNDMKVCAPVDAQQLRAKVNTLLQG